MRSLVNDAGRKRSRVSTQVLSSTPIVTLACSQLHKVVPAFLYPCRKHSCRSDPDYSYDRSSLVSNHGISGFHFNELDEATAASSQVPNNALDSSFPSSASRLPPPRGMDGNSSNTALSSHEMQQEGGELLGFPQDFSPEFDESSLAYFLNGIMVPPMPAPTDYILPMNQPYQARTPRDFLDFGTFNIDSFDMDMMLGDGRPTVSQVSNSVPVRVQPTSGTQTPSFGDRIASGNAAFMRSVWLWTPTQQDFGGKDSLNLSLPSSDMDSPETRAVAGHSTFHQRLETTMRDKILGFVLSTCDPSLFTSIASSFPSADLLNKLLHLYMTVHAAQKDTWLHLPTFELDDDTMLLTIMLVSAGAVICSVPSIRRLGFALQETVRTGNARKVGCPFGVVNDSL